MAVEVKEKVPFEDLPLTPKVRGNVEADIKRLRKLGKQQEDLEKESKLIKASLYQILHEGLLVEAVGLPDGATLSLFEGTRSTLKKELLLNQGVSPRVIENATETSNPFPVVKITEAKKG